MATHYLFSHCAFNMNTRAPGISLWEGAVVPLALPLIGVLERVHQFPCPETLYLGLRRWWFVREQYDNVLYRSISRRLGRVFARLARSQGAREAVFVGMGLSPSCAVREVQSSLHWGGRPREVSVEANNVEGRGVFVEEVASAFEEEGLAARFTDLAPALIYPRSWERKTLSYPRGAREALLEVLGLLGIKVDEGALGFLEGLGTIERDRRRGLNLVIERSLAASERDWLAQRVLEGYGLVLVEEPTHREDWEVLEDAYYMQLANQLRAGQRLVVRRPSGPMLGGLLERLRLLPGAEDRLMVTG